MTKAKLYCENVIFLLFASAGLLVNVAFEKDGC